MLEYIHKSVYGILSTMASSENTGVFSFTPSLRLRTPAEIFVKYGPCSRHRLATVARLQDKVVRKSLCIRVDVHIELSYGPVQHDMLELRGSLGQITMGTV